MSSNCSGETHKHVHGSNPSMHTSIQKQPDIFDKIFQDKTWLGEYLKES